MTKFTPELIRKIAPRASKQLVVELPALFNEFMPRHKINTRKRICLFLANTLTETGGFRKLEENLNYSAKRLRQVWPSRFPTNTIANRYARNPEALANFVYGNRGGNRGHPGFGWKHRGSGLMMTTFLNNYIAVQKATGLPVVAKPEMLREARTAVQSACIYWEQNGCNELADGTQITKCRRVINGGTHGLKMVKRQYNRNMPLLANIELGPAKKGPATIGVGGAGSAALAIEQSGYNPWVIAACFAAALAGIAYMVYKRKIKNDEVQLNIIEARGIQQRGDDADENREVAGFDEDRTRAYYDDDEDA